MHKHKRLKISKNVDLKPDVMYKYFHYKNVPSLDTIKVYSILPTILCTDKRNLQIKEICLATSLKATKVFCVYLDIVLL